MFRITIRPNGYPAHAHGDLIFIGPRECVVDPSATACKDPGAPGVITLTTKAYEELRAKNGGPVAIDPAGGVLDAAQRIADLEARVAELEALLAAATTVASPAEAPAKAKK